MIISFFEEFPTTKNLSKIKLVTWPTKLYLAAKSLKEFNRIKSEVKNKHIREFVYWPILSFSEGYWISPFSKKGALVRIFNEIKNEDIAVMIDAELPTTTNPLLYITQLFNFSANKSLIKKFIHIHPRVYVCECYPEGRRKEKILSFLGLHFNPKKSDSKTIKMVYHSMHNFDKDFITKELKVGKKEFGEKLLIAYGLIATGIQKKEPLTSYAQLREDLEIAKQAGIKEVIIYRLGGLNEGYASLLKHHSTT